MGAYKQIEPPIFNTLSCLPLLKWRKFLTYQTSVYKNNNYISAAKKFRLTNKFEYESLLNIFFSNLSKLLKTQVFGKIVLKGVKMIGRKMP